ncbi:HIT family protein [Candidatus Nomurabacteria bacterium]|nr:HIT family protein [Candidatus Nomurabacteria bacterium]
MQNDTVFGKIIRGEIPATKVYEDDRFLAFLDINPVAKGHTLLIPKEQYAWIHEAPDEIIADIFVKANHLIRAMRKGLSCDFVQVSVVGNEVPHFHIHLIPRFLTEEVSGHLLRAHEPYASDEEAQVYRTRIASAL